MRIERMRINETGAIHATQSLQSDVLSLGFLSSYENKKERLISERESDMQEYSKSFACVTQNCKT